jgi:hypothetical protein
MFFRPNSQLGNIASSNCFQATRRQTPYFLFMDFCSGFIDKTTGIAGDLYLNGGSGLE